MMEPLILYESDNQKGLDKLKKNNKIWRIQDVYTHQLKELFEITHPHLKSSSKYSTELDKFIKRRVQKSNKLAGNWVYFPWNGHLIHKVNEKEYFLLRTNRNKNLINKNEQEELYNSCIGIVGLSVGSSIATSLAYQGIAKSMKLAEYDTLETTNLNRIRAGIKDTHKPKLEVVAQQIYEINPYSNLKLYPKGLTKHNLDDLLNKKPKPKVIFEIIDNFKMKILLRLKAKAAGIPIVMFANLGDKVLVDIERYDINKKIPLFNGLLGDLPDKILKNPKDDQNKYAVEIVGIKNVPKRALESVKQINKTLVGRPQLSSTVMISASLATFIARRIILGKSLRGGRKVFDVERLMH